MEPDDKQKTALATRRGLFQFKVMPFGLCCAPATFERLMESVFAGLHRDICLVYLDDVIVTGKTFEEMLASLRRVFDRLQNAGFKLKAKKCCLFANKVTYLGHVVSEKGVATDPDKTAAVEQWPVPTNATENPEGQLARWLEILSTYSFEIQHRPGNRPEEVRAISQASDSRDDDDNPLLSMKDMQDNEISLVKRWVKEKTRPERFEEEDGKTIRLQAIVPSSQRRTIFEYCHDVRIAAHLGVSKTLARIRQKFYWPGLQADTRMYIAGCEICCKRKSPQMKK
ncbi:uncharacterized protein K02A2.6-like [Saccostrea cucullata]|uniref:uncharacterized protein K02A2.6-like n=1 Tax=Saccostrea cuccullata TaxID=36930 RepID=UPI002ED2F574